MHLDELSIACVGTRYANPRRKGRPTGNREMEIMFTHHGDTVILMPEPTNAHDQNAVAVYSKDGVQMGYVSADRTIIIREALEAKRTVHALLQQRTPWGTWIRIGVGREPSLPPEAAPTPRTPSQVADFYPDKDPGYDGVDYIPPDE